MNNKLKSMRDAEANNYYNDTECTGWELRAFDTDNFKAGWDARDKIYNEALKIAVEAFEDLVEELEFRMLINQEVTPDGDSGKHDKISSAGFGILLRAREEITKIRELMGEK